MLGATRNASALHAAAAAGDLPALSQGLRALAAEQTPGLPLQLPTDQAANTPLHAAAAAGQAGALLMLVQACGGPGCAAAVSQPNWWVQADRALLLLLVVTARRGNANKVDRASSLQHAPLTTPPTHRPLEPGLGCSRCTRRPRTPSSPAHSTPWWPWCRRAPTRTPARSRRTTTKS